MTTQDLVPTERTREKNGALLWFDLETNGLEVIDGPDEVIEVGFGLTDIHLFQLTPVVSMFVDLPYTGSELRSISPDAVQEMHDKSGLWDAYDSAGEIDVRHSLPSIEAYIMNMLSLRVEDDCPVTIAGMGVSTFDIPIIKAMMPRLARRVTYYPYDMSSFERVLQSFVTGEIRSTSKSAAHRSVGDIEYAQDLARKLRQHFRVVPPTDSFNHIFPNWRS